MSEPGRAGSLKQAANGAPRGEGGVRQVATMRRLRKCTWPMGRYARGRLGLSTGERQGRGSCARGHRRERVPSQTGNELGTIRWDTIGLSASDPSVALLTVSLGDD